MLPQLVVAEVREADDALPADAQHLVDHALDVLHGLQRLREDDAVELLGRRTAEALVQVGLDHVQAALHARDDRPVHPVRRPSGGWWPSRLRRASRPPRPQPRSSTLAPAGIKFDDAVVVEPLLMEDARRARGVRRRRSTPGVRTGPAVQVGQERADQFAVAVELVGQQERVVAAVALDVAVAHRACCRRSGR